MNYFVTAIGTDSGKTLASAILCEAWKADYWKPVQAGYPRDTEIIQHWLSHTDIHLHPEQYLLSEPISPHAAARAEGITLSPDDFTLPKTDRPLIIEGAGGLLAPLSDDYFMLDLIKTFRSEVVLVSNHYLGSINHTLLTARLLQAHKVPVKGIIFNGDPQPETEHIILQQTGWPCLLHIVRESSITFDVIHHYALQLRQQHE